MPQPVSRPADITSATAWSNPDAVATPDAWETAAALATGSLSVPAHRVAEVEVVDAPTVPNDTVVSDVPAVAEAAIADPEAVFADVGPVVADIDVAQSAAIVQTSVPKRGQSVGKSIQEWIKEGEELYEAAFREFQELESQINELQQRIALKQEEVNQIASLVGKPPVDTVRSAASQLGGQQLIDPHSPSSVPNSSNTIARALAGRTLSRS